jgi:hypothetical protein
MKINPVQNLRHFSRVPFDAAVQLQLHDRTINVQLIDIALKGALVKTVTQQALVSMESCRLVLPLTAGGESIVMVGRIVHLEDMNVGIECQDIDVTSLMQLRRLIELNTGDGDLMRRELTQLFAKREAVL